jgi:hypothetical protein
MAHIFASSALILSLKARINEEKEHNDLKNNIHLVNLINTRRDLHNKFFFFCFVLLSKQTYFNQYSSLIKICFQKKR